MKIKYLGLTLLKWPQLFYLLFLDCFNINHDSLLEQCQEILSVVMFSDRCTSWCKEWFDCTFPCTKLLFTLLPVNQKFYHFSVEMEACPESSKLLKLSPGHSPMTLENVTDLMSRRKCAEGDRKGLVCPFLSKIQQNLPKNPFTGWHIYAKQPFTLCTHLTGSFLNRYKTFPFLEITMWNWGATWDAAAWDVVQQYH